MSLAQRVHGHLSGGTTLHDAILQTLAEVLRACRQRDDITVVTVRVRDETVAVTEVERVG